MDEKCLQKICEKHTNVLLRKFFKAIVWLLSSSLVNILAIAHKGVMALFLFKATIPLPKMHHLI